jgi:stage III sporulation protein AH
MFLSEIDLSHDLPQEEDTYDEFDVPAVSVAEIDYFTEAKMERMRSRSYSMDYLKNVAESSGFHDSVRIEAQQLLVSLIRRSEYEFQIEELVRAKGFSDCFALVHDTGVSVVIQTNFLVSNSVAKVADIVERVTGISRENIVIAEY